MVHNGTQPIRIIMLNASIFRVSDKSEGEEKEKETPLLCTIIFLFLQVGCTDMLFHTGLCSAARNWRKLYKNLTVLRFLDAYT